MQESKFYQRQRERIIRENTTKHILTLLEQQFHTEAVRALTPMLQNIDDLERLKDLYLQAIHAHSLQAFTQKLIQ